MTLLDDYELRFKLQGVLAVQAMLKHVPVDVLKRTGMHALLRSVRFESLLFLIGITDS